MNRPIHNTRENKDEPRVKGWNRHVTVLLSFVLFMIYNEYTLVRNNQNQAYAPLPLARRRRLADGCHHVFIDAGANIGVQ